MTDLRIPEAAWTAANEALGFPPTGHGAIALALPAAAPLIVAAELRARAAYFDSFHREPGEQYGSALTHVVAHLRARAEEIDPSGGQP